MHRLVSGFCYFRFFSICISHSLSLSFRLGGQSDCLSILNSSNYCVVFAFFVMHALETQEPGGHEFYSYSTNSWLTPANQLNALLHFYITFILLPFKFSISFNCSILKICFSFNYSVYVQPGLLRCVSFPQQPQKNTMICSFSVSAYNFNFVAGDDNRNYFIIDSFCAAFVSTKKCT